MTDEYMLHPDPTPLEQGAAGQREIHDHAHRLARGFTDTVSPCLREEERKDCFEEAYRLAAEELRRFARALATKERRMRPTGK